MKTMNSRELLNNAITGCVNNYEVNKNFQTIAKTIQDKIKVGKLADLFSNNLTVDMFTLFELYHLTKALKEYVEKNSDSANIKKIRVDDLNVTTYFTPVEVNNFENEVTIIEESVENNVIVLHNVTQTTNKQWICGKITIQEIAEIIYSGKVKYDFRMQRESEKVNLFGQVVERAKVYKKSVKEIMNAMLNGQYTPTAITLNMLNNGLAKYNYDEQSQIMTIIDGEKALIDGYHRTLAGLSALGLKKDLGQNLEQIMQMNITHFTVTEARSYISQEGQGNKINPSLLKFYDNSDDYNIIAKAIGEEGTKKTNILFNNIGKEVQDIEKLGKYTTYEILQKAIEGNFVIKENDMKERRKVQEYLTLFFNELISTFKDDIVNIDSFRKISYALHYNIFYMYIALAKHLYNKDKWENELEQIISKIDFSKSNSQLKDLGLEKDKLNKSNLTKIDEYVKNISIKEVE